MEKKKKKKKKLKCGLCAGKGSFRLLNSSAVGLTNERIEKFDRMRKGEMFCKHGISTVIGCG